MMGRGKIAVYERPNGPFEVREYPLRPPRADEILVKVRMSTICRSDIHSYQGHRPNPCPGVLGHEIIGTIVEIGANVNQDLRGDDLAIGDRITWSEYFIPGANYYSDVLDLPQKSPAWKNTAISRWPTIPIFMAASPSTAISCRALGCLSCLTNSPTKKRRRSIAASRP